MVPRRKCSAERSREVITLEQWQRVRHLNHRANLFFQVVSRLYEKGSVIVTTNRRFESWADIFAGDAVIAGAILARILHHRHILAINGPSYRTPDLTGGPEFGIG